MPSGTILHICRHGTTCGVDNAGKFLVVVQSYGRALQFLGAAAVVNGPIGGGGGGTMIYFGGGWYWSNETTCSVGGVRVSCDEYTDMP